MAKNKKKSKTTTSKQLSDRTFLTQKVRSLPIFACYVSKDYEETGEAQVVVARERGNGNLCVGFFDVDLWCLGVKDAYGMFNIPKDEFKQQFIEGSIYSECDYVHAHNLIYGAEAFAADAGIEPASSFALWSHVLEEDTEDVPLEELEFGHNGKYHLIADRGSKESLYAFGLKERLGDDFIFDIGYGEGNLSDDDWDDEDWEDDDDWDDEDDWEDDDDWDDEDDWDDDDLDEDKLFGGAALLAGLGDGLKLHYEEDRRHPEEPYSYSRPDYPDQLNIKHKFIAEEFKKPTNSLALPTKVIDRILALPVDEVICDISNIVMHKTGATWKAIDEGSIKWAHDDTIIHSMLFLTQFGDERGLETVLEVLRQNNEFREFHMGDSDGMIMSNAVYATGHNHPETMMEFLMHPGYSSYSKAFVSDALSFIAMEEPERRDFIIDTYRHYLNFMLENIPTLNGCSGHVAGTIMSNLIDLKAKELLPEIKELYDKGYVNLNMCGDYEEVESQMASTRTPLDRYDFTDIKTAYQRLQRAFRH